MSIKIFCLECKQAFYSNFDDESCPNCKNIRIKKQLEAVLLICSKCEDKMSNGAKCREVHISTKIASGFGCGNWRIEGIVLEQEVYDSVKRAITVRQIIDNILNLKSE
jgi:ribosomal protein L37AE/L43A